MRHAAALQAFDLAAEVQLVVIGQARRDVVGREDRRLGCALQALGAHHAHVHPADRQHGGIAERCRGDRADAAGDAAGAMRRQERHEVFHHAHRAHARAATAVRNAEGLVQVEVAHVATELARRRHADERVHVGAVDVHAAAVAVHDLA